MFYTMAELLRLAVYSLVLFNALENRTEAGICINKADSVGTVGSVHDLRRKGGCSLRTDDSNCDRIQSTLISGRCFGNGYVGKQPVAWKLNILRSTGGFLNAQDSIPVELPEVVREGATCHVIDGLTLNVDLKLFDEFTNEIIPYNEEIHIPEDEPVPGKCSTGSQDLYYVTPDGFLEINMKFSLQEDDDSSVWNLDHFAILVLQPNVSNMAEEKDQFAKRDGMLKQGTTLFRAPVNITYQCTRINSVVYPSNIHSAMIFSQAKLQPYSEYVQISSDRGGYICPRRRRSNIKERTGSGEYLVPIILATSLGIVLLLLVIGYLLLKKIGKLGYQNME